MPKYDDDAIRRIVDAYRGWWPLALPTICRALVAAEHPLASTPLHEFLDRLAGVTPEVEVQVRRSVRQALKAGVIPRKAVDLREGSNAKPGGAEPGNEEERGYDVSHRSVRTIAEALRR